MEEKKNVSRRSFLTNAGIVGAVGVVATGSLLKSCSTDKKPVVLSKQFNDKAPEGQTIRAAVVGCGGRGTGAALNFLDAGDKLEIVAVGDLFKDKIENFRNKLKEQKNVELADEMCFTGWDAIDKVLEQDIDYVILATPPHFRPDHYSKAIAAKKNVFMEKPIAVDPVGIRSILATTEKAKALGLNVATGTQRRHARDYNDIYAQVKSGMIGEITGAACYWNQGKLWHRNPRAEWSEMEAMIRNWVNWTWLSGDHIVEQHVHNIDVVNWFMDSHPVKAVGFGSRQRRITGDQFDNFSVDFVYPNDIHVHSMCRQINGCTNNVSEYVRGAEGYTNCSNTIFNPDGTEKYKYQYPLNDKGEPVRSAMISDYVQEHIDLVTAIRTGEQFVEAENTAFSNMTALMGRISAYTGKEVTWDEMLNTELKLAPKKYVMGKVEIDKEIPIAGVPAEENIDR